MKDKGETKRCITILIIGIRQKKYFKMILTKWSTRDKLKIDLLAIDQRRKI